MSCLCQLGPKCLTATRSPRQASQSPRGLKARAVSSTLVVPREVCHRVVNDVFTGLDISVPFKLIRLSP